jgi:hypothetical protein
MKLTVRKLDRRYKGFGQWTHRLELDMRGDYAARLKRMVAIHEIRCMLSVNFGAGCNVDEAYALQQHSVELPQWAFNSEGDFFLRDQALVLIELSKERWQ